MYNPAGTGIVQNHEKSLVFQKSATVQQQLKETLNTTEPAPDAGTEWARLRDPVYGTNHELLCVTQRKQRLVRQK